MTESESDVEIGEPEMVYHSGGELEPRDGTETDRWITTDSPVEVRQ